MGLLISMQVSPRHSAGVGRGAAGPAVAPAGARQPAGCDDRRLRREPRLQRGSCLSPSLMSSSRQVVVDHQLDQLPDVFDVHVDLLGGSGRGRRSTMRLDRAAGSGLKRAARLGGRPARRPRSERRRRPAGRCPARPLRPCPPAGTGSAVPPATGLVDLPADAVPEPVGPKRSAECGGLATTGGRLHLPSCRTPRTDGAIPAAWARRTTS